MENITSLKNPKIISWRSLRERKGRESLDAFLVEGPKMVQEALSSSFTVRALLLREDTPLPFPVPDSVPVYGLPSHVFASVSDTVTPQGIAAVLSRTPRPIDGKHLVCLDGVQDPGNVGTIIRTADAAGLDGVILSASCADLFSPKVVRATMGSIFRMGFDVSASLHDDLRTMRENGFSIISSQLDGDPFYARTSIGSSFVLVIGNEAHGVSPEIRQEATHRLALPMRGGAESLNAAVAAGIMMYDLMRD